MNIKLNIQRIRIATLTGLKKAYEYIKPRAISITEYINECLDYLLEKMVTKDHKLNAGFGNAKKLLSRKNGGFVIDGKRSISSKQSRSNVAIIAPSGTGKSQVCVFPSIINIAQSGASMLINDPHSELSSTIPFLISEGYEIIELDFSPHDIQFYYNPLLRCTDYASTNKVATLLLKQGLGGGKNNSSTSSFFNTKAIELVGLMINYLRELDMPDYYNLANVFHLLENMAGEPDSIKAMFIKSSAKLASKYKSFIGASSDTLSSIVATAQASLSFIGNDQLLSKLTSQDNIDFDSFREGKAACFVRVPIGDSTYYQKVVGLFFEQYFNHVFSKLPSDDETDVFIILDEMSALAPTLSDFSNIISSGRKFRIPILGVLQSENQLYDVYGQHQAKTILNNFNVKVYFSGLYDEADRLEKFLGKYSYSEKLKNGHETTCTRSLMTADEIRNMPINQVLCITSGMKPLRLKVTPAYKQPELLKLLQMQEEEPLLLEASDELTEEELEDAAFADFAKGNAVSLLPVPEVFPNQNAKKDKEIPPHQYAEKLKEYKDKIKNR